MRTKHEQRSLHLRNYSCYFEYLPVINVIMSFLSSKFETKMRRAFYFGNCLKNIFFNHIKYQYNLQTLENRNSLMAPRIPINVICTTNNKNRSKLTSRKEPLMNFDFVCIFSKKSTAIFNELANYFRQI